MTYDPTNFPNGIAVGALAINGFTQADSINWTIGAEATNAINVAAQVRDSFGNDIASSMTLGWYLADDAAGLTPSTVAPDGGVAIGTDGALIESVANLSGRVVLEADGQFDVDITESGAKSYYLVVTLPNGKNAVSGAITFA